MLRDVKHLGVVVPPRKLCPKDFQKNDTLLIGQMKFKGANNNHSFEQLLSYQILTISLAGCQRRMGQHTLGKSGRECFVRRYRWLHKRAEKTSSSSEGVANMSYFGGENEGI